MSFIEPIRRKIEKILHEIGIHNKAYDSDLDGILDDTAIPDFSRSKITDFFTSPFWNNIPDKPNVVISPMIEDLDANQYRIFNLPFPTASYEVATKEYVDLATVGFGLALYLLDTQDSTYTDYKATTIEIPTLSEAYVEAQSNVAGDILVGQWISPNGFVTTLKKGLYELHFQAQRISGNITLRSYFELYERQSDGTEILIATSSIADIFDERRDIYVTLVLDQDYILATDSRIVIKIYIRFESQGAGTTGRIYYQGDVRSRLSMPTAKEVLDTIYASRYHASQHELGGDDELSLDASQITSGVFDLTRIPNIDWGRISGNFPRAIGDLISSAFSRSWISDFFSAPFWDNIPDKPSVYPPELHASAHAKGGADELSLDATQITSGVLSADRIPGLDASKIVSGRLSLSRLPTSSTANRILIVRTANADPVWTTLTAGDIPNLDASKITSGVFDVARIPDLSRSKITDFFSSPFWDNIPDKPSFFPPESHSHSISDVNFDGNFIPTANNSYDLGSSSYKLKDGYFAGTVHSGDIEFKNEWRITEFDDDGEMIDGLRILNRSGKEIFKITEDGLWFKGKKVV